MTNITSLTTIHFFFKFKWIYFNIGSLTLDSVLCLNKAIRHKEVSFVTSRRNPLYLLWRLLKVQLSRSLHYKPENLTPSRFVKLLWKTFFSMKTTYEHAFLNGGSFANSGPWFTPFKVGLMDWVSPKLGGTHFPPIWRSRQSSKRTRLISCWVLHNFFGFCQTQL